MRILVLHPEVSSDAAFDDQETLWQAADVERALRASGHEAVRAAFRADAAAFNSLLAERRPELVFNLVETVWGQGRCAPFAAALLAGHGVAFTGADAAAMIASGDKLLTKRLLRGAGLPTPDWSTAPHWEHVDAGRWIVKSVDEDASLGLDDGAVVRGRAAVAARAHACAARFGGRWFAERYVDGREFHVPLIERGGQPVALPVSEVTYAHADDARPRIYSYAAKWDVATADYRDTSQTLDWPCADARLVGRLGAIARSCWRLLGLRGYARVDLRVDADHRPSVLEVNANPCLGSYSCFAAAGERAGLSYDQLLHDIIHLPRAS